MLTYAGANALINLLAGCADTSTFQYKTIFVGLSTTPPNRDGTGVTEPSTEAGYKRTWLGRSQGSATAYLNKMEQASIGATTNKDFIYFPEATAAWGTCTHFLIFGNDNDTGDGTNSTLLAYGPLTNTISPSTGTVPIIRVGDLDMSIS